MTALILFLVAINLTSTIWFIYILNYVTVKFENKLNEQLLELYTIHAIADDIAESLEIYEEEDEEEEEPTNNVIEQKEVK